VPTSSVESIPLTRIIEIAEFRAGLRAFLRHSEHACRNWELTPQRFQLLLAVKGAPDGSEQLSVTALAQRLQQSRNSVTELCARAEEAGLIERKTSDEDGRIVFIRSTTDGERRLLGVLAESDQFRAELLAAFNAITRSLDTATRLQNRPD
jgi:DNA-binding MarR family transcriptional regulator